MNWRKNMSKFKIGDRVLVKDNYCETFARGQTATIRHDDGTGMCQYLIEFDNEFPDCHDGDGRCHNNHGWWIDGEWLQPIERIKLGIFKKENKEKSIKIKSKDPVYKELSDIAKKYDGVRGVVCYAGCDFEFSDEIKKALIKNDRDCDVQLNANYELKAEIIAQLTECETYEQKMNVLKAYGVVDAQGKLIK